MALNSDSTPDYDRLKELLSTKFSQKELAYDYIYDWSKKANDIGDDSESGIFYLC